MTHSNDLRSLLLVGVLLAELAISAVRVSTARTAPFSGRFSWSMFAGPITARCVHDVTATDSQGRSVALPQLRDPSPIGALLRADTPARFASVAPWIAPYADSDADVARALDEVLGRYHRSLQSPLTLTSILRCDSPGSARFTRTARWTAR